MKDAKGSAPRMPIRPKVRTRTSGSATKAQQAIVTAELASADSMAAIHERDAMAEELQTARAALVHAKAEIEMHRAEVAHLQTKLAEATPFVSRDVSVQNVGHRLVKRAQTAELAPSQKDMLTQAAKSAGAMDALAQTSLDLERVVEERTAKLAMANVLLQSVADSVPHLVWSSKPGGDWYYANRRWIEHTGQSVEDAAGFGWLAAVHLEDRDRVMAAWRAAGAAGELRVEHRLRGRDGSFEWFETRSVPMRDVWDGEGGEAERWFGTSTNIDAARRAELALRESETRFRGFAEATTDVLWVIDTETGQLEYLGPAFERVWGESRDRIMADLGRWAELLHPDDRENSLSLLPRTVAGEQIDREYRIIRASDGAVRWVNDIGFPLRDALGRVRQIAGLARDITARKDAESNQQLLLAELNHRVKNALATAQAVASLTARTAATPAAFQAAFQARLIALARAHDLLTQKAWRGAFLGEVVHRTMAPHTNGKDSTKRILADGPEVWLRPETAIALHMALHELATNAAKHGALSVPNGRIEISWQIATQRREERRIALEMLWREQSGPPVQAHTWSGFGTRLLQQGLPRQLGGEATLTFRPAGIEYRLVARFGISPECIP